MTESCNILNLILISNQMHRKIIGKLWNFLNIAKNYFYSFRYNWTFLGRKYSQCVCGGNIVTSHGNTCIYLYIYMFLSNRDKKLLLWLFSLFCPLNIDWSTYISMKICLTNVNYWSVNEYFRKICMRSLDTLYPYRVSKFNDCKTL